MVPFVGPSYSLNTRKADVQRAVNLFPVINEVDGGKSRAHLASIPGMTVFSDAAVGAVEGWNQVTAVRGTGMTFAEGGYLEQWAG